MVHSETAAFEVCWTRVSMHRTRLKVVQLTPGPFWISIVDELGICSFTIKPFAIGVSLSFLVSIDVACKR
jgi:hypothetical protein